MPGQPVLTFLLGGGAWGIASHVIAIVRGVLEKPPMLRGAYPVAAVTLAFFTGPSRAGQGPASAR